MVASSSLGDGPAKDKRYPANKDEAKNTKKLCREQ